MESMEYGKYLNKDGKGKYANFDAPEKLINYVTRQNGKNNDDLIAWGGLGVTEYKDMGSIIKQFYCVQKKHTRTGNYGRYMNHSIFSFSPEATVLIHEKELDIDKIARKMAHDIYDFDHCQIIYGVHQPENGNLHIHFATNSVDYYTGNKRHENIAQTKERKIRFNKIIADEITNSFE